MLRLWSSQLRIALFPEEIALVKLSGGLRARLVNEKRLTVPNQQGVDWHAALETLKSTLLNEPVWQQGAHATVVLSNHWVRYLVLPWSAQIRGEAEQLAYARLLFQQTYGEKAAEWVVHISEEQYGKPRIAAAIDHSLLASLRQLSLELKLPLTSVKPYLMTAFNRYRPRFKKDRVSLMLVEPSKVVIAYLNDGLWQSIRARTISEPLTACLPQLITEQALTLPEEDKSSPIYVLTPNQAELDLTWIGSRPVYYLNTGAKGLAIGQEASYAMNTIMDY